MKYSIIKIIFYLFVSGTVALHVMSCQHDPLEIDIDPVDPIDPMDTMSMDTISVIIPCDPDSVYFRNDILPIIQGSCAFTGCHGDGSAQGGVDLTSYESIIRTAEVVPFNLGDSELYEVITENDADKVMPPAPQNPLTPTQIQLIAKWILVGAPNNSCDDCDTDNVTFSQVVYPIIKNSCEGCHGVNNPSAGISLTNHTQIQTIAQNGSLLGTVAHQSGFVPMPYNQQKLDSCKIDQIRIWLENGALDN